MGNKWKQIRHNRISKTGKTFSAGSKMYIEKYKKSVPVMAGDLKHLYPTAYDFAYQLYQKDEEVKATLDQIRIRFFPKDARPEYFGKPPDTDAESFPEEKFIRIFTSDNKWTKINKNSLYQNAIIVHELIHIIEKHHAEKKKGYITATTKEWGKYPEEELATKAEKLFVKKYK